MFCMPIKRSYGAHLPSTKVWAFTSTMPAASRCCGVLTCCAKSQVRGTTCKQPKTNSHATCSPAWPQHTRSGEPMQIAQRLGLGLTSDDNSTHAESESADLAQCFSSHIWSTPGPLQRSAARGNLQSTLNIFFHSGMPLLPCFACQRQGLHGREASNMILGQSIIQTVRHFM